MTEGVSSDFGARGILRHAGLDPASSRAISIARGNVFTFLEMRSFGSPTLAGWMPDQVRHDGGDVWFARSPPCGGDVGEADRRGDPRTPHRGIPPLPCRRSRAIDSLDRLPGFAGRSSTPTRGESELWPSPRWPFALARGERGRGEGCPMPTAVMPGSTRHPVARCPSRGETSSPSSKCVLSARRLDAGWMPDRPRV